MSTTTPNYGLVKPAGGENYDVAVPNANMDTIDTALEALDGRVDDLEVTGLVNGDGGTYRFVIKVVSVSLSASGSGTQTVDVSSYGFTSRPYFWLISNNFSYYGYESGAGTQDENTITIGVRHYDNTSATTSVSTRVLIIGPVD